MLKKIKIKLSSVNVDFVVYDVEGDFFGKVAVQFENNIPNKEIFFAYYPKEKEDFNWFSFEKKEYFDFFFENAINDYQNNL